MSNVLAIAAVTQILKDLLHDALIDGDAIEMTGADVSVTALPPDRIVNDDPAQQATQINLYLHRVTPNAALRNADLPTRDASGRLLCRPRLALDLHYILTVVSADELHPEILLGYAMQLFHEHAILPRERIREALTISGPEMALPGPPGMIQAAAIADQIELIKITPRSLSMDDMSKMWTALQASYRTTVAYDVSLVLIEREQPTRPTVPVLTRGGLRDADTGRDPGVLVSPTLSLAPPTLLSVEPLDRQPVMRLGRDIALNGLALDRGEARVRFAEVGTGKVLELAPLAPVTPGRMVVRLPAGDPLPGDDPPPPPPHTLHGTGADPGAWRIGAYDVSILLVEPGGRQTETNALPVALAPASTSSAIADLDGTEITMTSSPPIRPGQSVAILVGQTMQLVATPAEPATQAQAVFTGLASGAQLPVRLRVNGVDSPVIDRATDPPTLQTVTIP